ncbi:hypothetical protein T439DRAFT_21199 [Meredithblackwellia eburnea MCA 4105]
MLVLVTIAAYRHSKGRAGSDFDRPRAEENEHGVFKNKDAYLTPGYISRREPGDMIRWIPNSFTGSQTDSLQTPLDTRFTSHSTPPDYSSMLNLPSRRSDQDLEFLKNKSILLIGEAVERSNVYAFCSQHPGSKITLEQWHLASACKLQDFNFTMAMWFHSDETPASRRPNSPSEFWGRPTPDAWGRRIKEQLLPTLSTIGNPDMIVVSSQYWDAEFGYSLEIHRRRVAGMHHLPPMNLFVNDAMWWYCHHLSRALEDLRETFPGIPVMFQPTAKWAKWDGISGKDLGLLKESVGQALKRKGVPFFNWALLVEREKKNTTAKPLHSGQTGWLYTSMALYYLKRFAR